jgi:endonuclease-3
LKKSDVNNQKKILKKLKELYPDANCALEHENAFQLLCSTILSAQCTDARVNMVTPKLFKTYPSPLMMAKAPLERLEDLIRSTGFYKNKAKSLQQTSASIVEKFDGKVPDTMEDLTSLRGVGRKTANVVLGNAFGKNEGVVVDTHVGRLSRRLGLTKHEDPVKVEQDLMKIVPKADWTVISHEMISHGRALCKAQRPKCEICPLADLCPSFTGPVKSRIL